jgi:hypothetical protein
MAIPADISEIVEACTYAISVAIKKNNPDPDFEVYEHDAVEMIGNNGCLVTMYEYDVSALTWSDTRWRLRYGVQIFHASQRGLIDATNLAIQAIKRPFPTEKFGNIQATSIHAVTDYYKATSRLTNLVFYISLRLRPYHEPAPTIDDYTLGIDVKES